MCARSKHFNVRMHWPQAATANLCHIVHNAGPPQLFIALPVKASALESKPFQEFRRENEPSKRMFSPENMLAQKVLGCGKGDPVCLIQNAKTNDVYARKVLNVLDKNDKLTVRNLREVRILQECHASNIIKFYGCNVLSDGQALIFMEVMDASLDKLYMAVDDMRIPERHLSNIALATAKAMDYLYYKMEKPVLHRDIKPANILINQKGNVKITDLGEARQFEHADSIATTYVGTRLYMSPERIRGIDQKLPTAVARKVNVAGEIWSLGVSLIELAVGRKPLPKMSIEEQQRWMKADKTARNRRLAKEESVNMNDFELLKQLTTAPLLSVPSGYFSECFKTFVDECLAVEPLDRPKLGELRNKQFLLNASTNVTEFSSWIADNVKLCQV